MGPIDLTDKDLIVDVKRRLPPSYWPAVQDVLRALQLVLATREREAKKGGDPLPGDERCACGYELKNASGQCRFKHLPLRPKSRR